MVSWDEASSELVGRGLWGRCLCSAGNLRRRCSWTKHVGHGDGFVVIGPNEGVDRLKGSIQDFCEVMVRVVLCRDADDDKVVVVLGWTVRLGKEGAELKVDEWHGELIKRETGTEPDSNGVVSPVVREDVGEGETEEKFTSSATSRSRRVSARTYYLVRLWAPSSGANVAGCLGLGRTSIAYGSRKSFARGASKSARYAATSIQRML